MFSTTPARHPVIAEHLGVVLVVIIGIAGHTAGILDDVIVNERRVQLQRGLCGRLGLFPIAMEQIDLGKQGIAESLVRMVDVDGLLM